MTKPGDSFVAEDFLRAKKGDVVLWTTASLIVIAGLAGGYWAYQTFVPAEQAAGPPPGAMVVEFAEFAVSPETEELDLPEGELSAASEATPPTETEPEPEAEPTEEPEPVVEPEVEPEEVAETAEAEVEPQSEPEVEPTPDPLPEPVPEPTPEPEPAVVPEPVEPIIDVPEVDVPEPAVVIQRQMATVERPEPEPVVAPEEIVESPEPEPEPEPVPEPVPEEPAVEPIDPNLPAPVTMSPRIAETRENTPATKFTPPPRRTPPPQQAATQASAPKPQEQQAQQAAAPRQAASAEPSASQVNRWESSVLRHLGQRRRYPADARQRGEEGRVIVQFTIDVAGNVQSVSIARSSGFASLDQAARDLVYASSPVPRPPDGLPRARLTIGMPIDYER